MELDPDLDWRVLAKDGFNAHIGAVALAEINPFEWRFRLEVAEQHINLGGVCHGGVSMTLADIGMGYAAATALGRVGCTTIAFDAQFIAAAKLGQTLHGVARVTRATRDLAFVEGALYAGRPPDDERARGLEDAVRAGADGDPARRRGRRAGPGLSRLSRPARCPRAGRR